MTTHRESRIVEAPRERLFDLVADVERYPEFLPLWRTVRVYRRWDNGYATEQEVGLGPIRQRFFSDTIVERPNRIVVTSNDSLFESFAIDWIFSPAQDGCRVDVTLIWRVKNHTLQRVIDEAVGETARRMVGAFAKRARQMNRRRAGVEAVDLMRPIPAGPSR